MFSFQYKHGDRPLEGYTIERGAGRGGFGEVYYAVSDSGREVALKAILGYEQIELRGISNCMNLKNPHLVTIFDVKYNEGGKPFVIMEFVAGPSLRQLLDQQPSGLGTQKAAFFLREMGKGLTYLHDNGIVHRDLKPANVFYENGYVKIGDYGLSKAIAPTQHSAQTITVGTVHYMAPEIGAGKYDRSIDIYALGAVLYEMLTGMVPFNGATPSEILLKHLGSEIDTSGIAEPFASVIKKAMAKDPAQRYQSVQEMVEAVFGEEHVRQSVSVFSPDELSVVAGYAAVRAAAGARAGSAGGSAGAGAGGTSGQAAVATATASDPWERMGAWADRVTNRLVGNPVNQAASSRTMEVLPFVDPVTTGQRTMLGFLMALGIAVAGGALSQGRQEGVIVGPFILFSIIGGTIGTQIGLRKLIGQIENESPLPQKLAIGGMAALCGGIAAVPFLFFGNYISSNVAGTWLAIYAPLFFMNVAGWGAKDREERVSFWDTAFLVGLFAFVLASVFHGSWVVSAFTAGGICLVTQMLSPWNKEAAKAKEAREEKDQESNVFNRAFGSGKPVGPVVPPGVVTPGAAGAPIISPAPLNYETPLPRVFTLVPGYVRVIWLVLTIISFAIGVSMLVAAGFARSYDMSMFVGNGLAFLWGSFVFLIQACRQRFFGWWSYLLRPIAILVAGLSIIVPLVIMLCDRLNGEETAVAVFFMVFGALSMIAVWVIPATLQRPAMQAATSPAASEVPSTSPWHSRTRRRRMRMVLRPGSWSAAGFLFSMIAAVLVIVSIAATLASGLKLAQAVYWGIPDPNLARELNRNVFPDYQDWPKLVESALRTIGVMLMLIAIGFCTLARRRAGWIHMIRGVVGIALLVGSFAMLGFAFHRVDWWSISVDVHAGRIATAVSQYFGRADSGPLSAAAIMFVISQIMLMWTPGERRVKAVESTQSKGASV